MGFTEYYPEYKVPGVQHSDFSPYETNGGSIVAIGGDDFAVIAADSRLSSGYSIHTRKQNKLMQLSPIIILGSGGCWCDVQKFAVLLKARMQMYEYEHLRPMSTTAAAQLISIMMYNKRFFPYYVANVLAGLDENGEGIVYSYDPIGHAERSKYKAAGSAGAFLQPVLDNQIGNKNLTAASAQKMTIERAVAIASDAFISAAERDIYTGDSVRINILTKNGVEVRELPLRRD